MADEREPEEPEPDDEAEETLAELSRMRRRGRLRVHGGAWAAAAVLAALVLASGLLYREPFGDPRYDVRVLALRVPSWAGLPAEQISALASYAYWFIATPLAFALLAFWYRRRERRLGVRVRWQWIVGVGLGVLALLAVLAAVPVEPQLVNPGEVAPSDRWQWRSVLTPLLPVAAAVVALGWIERSRWLALAGCWLAFVTLWQCGLGMGGLPGWATLLLGGFEGPGLGGQLTLLGLHRPGPVLILAALPLIVYAVRHAWRLRELHRGG